MTALGIDLGTAYARAAVFRSKAPELLQFPDGAHSVPAVVALAGDGFKLGRAALGRAATHPTETVRGIKRFLGRRATDTVLQQLVAHAPFGVEEGKTGAAMLRLGNQLREAEDLAAALIAHLKEVAAQACGEPPTSVVLTTPYWYGPRQRQALSEAARRAGLSVLQVVSEATATALSLLEAERGNRLVAIVDVGAGGCTASVLELGPQKVRLVSSNGDPLGGGEDVDRGLVRAIVKGLRTRLGDFPDNPAVAEMIRQVVEGAKRDLRQAASVTAVVPFLPVGTGVYNQQVVIERDSVELLMADTKQRVGTACRKALQDAGVDRSQLSAVYATGGMARLPVVRGCITEALGEIASRMLDPDGSVALGAAYQAGMLMGDVESIPVLDVQRSRSLAPSGAASAQSLPPAQVHTAPPPAGERHSSAPPGSQTRSSTPPLVQRMDVESYRTELAGLLASMRAGAVTDGGRETGRQLVARTVDVIEDDAGLDAAELDKHVERLQEIWTQLSRVMKTARQYGWEHPQARRHLEHVVELIAVAQQTSPHGVRWDVGSMHLSFRGTVIWKPDKPPFDRIPYELFADGLRKMQLNPGLPADELRQLLGVLLRDAALGFGADDDAATAMWDRKFDHVAYVAVDSFAVGDDPFFQSRLDDIAEKLTKLASMSEEGGDVLGAYAAAHRETAGAAAHLALDGPTRTLLEETIEVGPELWQERYAHGFVDAHEHALRTGGLPALMDALDSWADEQVTAHASVAVFELLGALGGAFEARTDPERAADFRAEAVRTLLPLERLQAIVEYHKDTEQPSTSLVQGLDGALQVLPGDELFDSALRLYPLYRSEDLQKVLAGYLGRWASGHEAEIGSLIATAEAMGALNFLWRLREVGSEAAQAAIHAALESPHVEVRMEALACLPEAPAETLRGEVQRILEDPEPGVRRQALKTIAERRIVVAGPALVRRVQSAEFHDIEDKERKLMLEAVHALSPRRAEDIAIALLSKQQLIRSEAVEQTRAIAAEFLGTLETTEALDALQKAAKKRWFTTTSVRETAEKAVADIEERRSLRPPGTEDRS